MADKKDEIINLQLDIIRKMTENNIRRLSDDIWGPTRQNRQDQKKTPAAPPAPPASGKTTSGSQENAPADSSVKSDKNLIKASDGGDGGGVTDNAEDLPPKEDIADLKKELDSYIGLEEVKKEVKNLINMATVYKLRLDNNLPNPDMSLHLVFSGNPGTGKTMIARFMARVYHSLGLLSVGKLVEVDRSGLVAGYIGQTAIKTAKVLEEAKGSVLFIDEAYTLTSKTENDFGFEAVDTILKAMEDNRDDLVVIAAGYIELMEQFIDSNPGLRSRFNKYIDFADYTAEEMLGIFKMNCEKSCYVLDADAEKAVTEYFTAVGEAAGEFGNARGVRNTFEKILTEQANRIAELSDVTRDDLMKITAADVEAALFEADDDDPKTETDEKENTCKE
ncbi:MAG: AAA family ATPase [Clostridia bacterium]|nr:AAA family ATPase [Clostridia bacterium]